MLFFDADQQFGETERRVLDVAARRTADAVRRVRADALGTGPTGGGPTLGQHGHRAELELDSDPRSAGAGPPLPARAADRVGGRRRRRRHRPAVPLGAGEQRDHARPRQLRAHPPPRGRRAERDPRATAAAPTPVEGRAPAVRGPRGDEDELIVAGRGLMLVDALTDRWGTERNDVGTTAWFALDARAPVPAPSRPAEPLTLSVADPAVSRVSAWTCSPTSSAPSRGSCSAGWRAPRAPAGGTTTTPAPGNNFWSMLHESGLVPGAVGTRRRGTTSRRGARPHRRGAAHLDHAADVRRRASSSPRCGPGGPTGWPSPARPWPRARPARWGCAGRSSASRTGTSEAPAVFVLPGTSGANQRRDYDGRPDRLSWWRDLASWPPPSGPETRPTRGRSIPIFGYAQAADLRFRGPCDPGRKELSALLAKPDLPAYGNHNI